MIRPTSLYNIGKSWKIKGVKWSDVLEGFKSDGSMFTETDIHFIRLGFEGKSISESESLMPFGKYKGKPLDKVPVKYLTWCAEQEWLSDWPTLHQYLKENKYL